MSISEIAAPDAALPPRFADALSLFGENRHDEALVICEQIVASRPDSPEAIMLLGLISFELDEPIQAIDLLTRAHEAAPDIADYAEALAAVHARLGNTTEALFLVKLATTLTPHPSGTRLLPESLANFFDNVGSASPNKFRKRAEKLLRAGDHIGAENAVQMQLRLTPGNLPRLGKQDCRHRCAAFRPAQQANAGRPKRAGRRSCRSRASRRSRPGRSAGNRGITR